MDFSNIEIIVSEIDDVITDGKDARDHMDNIIFKTYRSQDFEAINELKQFFTFVFLSSSSEISYYMMRKRNIPTYFTSNKEDKLAILNRRILPRYNVKASNLMYVGSRVSDLPCIQVAEIGVAVDGASLRLRQQADLVLDPGKCGTITYLHDVLQEEINKRKRNI